jgi:hypothetical protein
MQPEHTFVTSLMPQKAQKLSSIKVWQAISNFILLMQNYLKGDIDYLTDKQAQVIHQIIIWYIK